MISGRNRPRGLSFIVDDDEIDEFTCSVEDNWGKVKETLLDILNNDTGKMKIAPRKPWITEAMVKKLEENRIAKTTNIKEYRRLSNQLRKETGKAKKVYMEEICEVHSKF